MGFVNKIKKLMYGGDWQVLYKKKGDLNYEVLKGEKNYWYADPFLFYYRRDYYLFTEAFDTSKQIGRIAVSTFDKEKKEFGIPKVIIKNEYHMSYPCVFEYDDAVYMIPETGEDNNLYIYHFIDFPFNLEKKIIIRKTKLADSTIFVYEGNLFLLAYDDVANKTILYNIDLKHFCAIYIKEFEHNEKKFRPAGNLFFKDGKLWRPTQNCSVSYGRSLIIREITDFFNLKESIDREVLPTDIGDYSKIHTFNCANDIETIDVFKPSFGVGCLVCNIKRKIHRYKMERKQ